MSFGAFTRRPAALLALGLCTVGVLVSVLGRLATGPHQEPKRTAFTNEAGAHAYPAFSPDGRQVAYSAHAVGKDETFHIFVQASSGGARQVTRGEGSDIGPAWSPDGGSLAFLRVDDDATRTMVIPSAGGEARQIAEFAVAGDERQPLPSVAWTHDGKSLVVAGAREGQPSALAVVAASGGAAKQITSPAKDTPGDFSPAVSPDGATIAFVRSTDSENREGGDVWLCDLAGGAVRRLTFDDHMVHGLAWTPDGRELVYSSNRGMGWRLWRLPAYGGTPRDLLVAGNQAQFPAISRDGRLLFTERAAESSIWRVDLGNPATPGIAVKDPHERPLVRSAAREIEPAISPDGKRIANVSDQGFDQQIWVGDADGLTPRYQLTQFPQMRLRHLRWSPDGAWLLYEARSQRGTETYKIEVKPNARPVRVLEGEGGASWSSDGKSIYYESGGELVKAAADGSGARPILQQQRRGFSMPEESVDGKFVYFRGGRTISRIPAEGGKVEEVVTPEHELVWSSLQAAKQGLYYLVWVRSQRRFVLEFYDFAAQKSSDVLPIKDIDMDGDGFRVSPDGKYVLYPKRDEGETNLVMVENFR
jgi:Tol biopolymer transport system component